MESDAYDPEEVTTETRHGVDVSMGVVYFSNTVPMDVNVRPSN